jgi:hypothetical protein
MSTYTAVSYPAGRRFNLIFGCGHSTVALAILVALIAIYGEGTEQNLAGQRAVVFMFFWFLVRELGHAAGSLTDCAKFAFSAMEPAYYVSRCHKRLKTLILLQLYITETFPNQVRVKGIGESIRRLAHAS